MKPSSVSTFVCQVMIWGNSHPKILDADHFEKICFVCFASFALIHEKCVQEILDVLLCSSMDLNYFVLYSLGPLFLFFPKFLLPLHTLCLSIIKPTFSII